MKILGLSRYASVVCVSIVLLAACSSGGSQSSIGVPNAIPQTSAIVPYAAHGKSWMAPGAEKQTNLLYISNWGTDDVTVYTYLDGSGLVLVGTLTGFSLPTGLCTDRAGNVWITDYGSRKIFEYAHGGTTPIFTITEFEAFPYDCAVDPTTGNLAVSNQHPNAKFDPHGDVKVYPKGRRPGKIYTTSGGFGDTYFVTYDDKSNLYVDASPCFYSYCKDEAGGPGLYRLANRGSAFKRLTLKGATLYEPIAINWIKPALLLGDRNFANQGTSGAYKLLVSGSTATVVNTLQFNGTQQTDGFWRRAGRVIVPDYTGNIVRIYNLSDGTLFSTMTTGISLPFGAVVSQ